MSSVAPYSHERGQLVSIRFCQWIVNGVCLNTLPPSILIPIFDPSDKLDAFFGFMLSGAAFTADVRDSRSCFRFGIENEDTSLRLFASKETLAVLQIVVKEAAQAEKFVIQTNMRVSEASVIYRLSWMRLRATGRAGKTCAGGSRRARSSRGVASSSKPAGWPTV